MPSRKEEEAAFLAMRPTCVALNKYPCESTLNNLEGLLNSRCWPPTAQLAEYCLFPIVKRLKEPKLDETLLVGCVKCISAASKAFKGVVRSKVFHDVLTTLVMLLSTKEDMTVPRVLPRKLSEEEKLALVTCLRVVFSTGGSVVCELSTLARLPAMGHMTALLLDLAVKERGRSLRVGCMLALDALCSGVRCTLPHMEAVLGEAGDGKHQFDVRLAPDNTINCSCAFSMAHFLPGIASSLAKVMRGDEKQGQKVTQAAIYMWTTCVAFVLADLNYPTADAASSDVPDQTPRSGSGTEMGKHRLPTVAYSTVKWWKGAAGQVHTLLQQLSSLHSHAQWKVRLFVVRMASTLLEHCRRSLSASVTILVEMLVALIADAYSQVAEVARKALAHFSQHINTASVPLVSLLEDGIYRAASTLPSVMRATDDRKKLSSVLLLQGYIQLLGTRLETLLSSPRLVQRLFHAFLMALEMDTSHASISLSHSLVSNGTGAVRVPGMHVQRTQLTFKHFHDDAIFKNLLLACSLLGYYGDLSSVVDSLLDILLLQPHLHKQIVLMINTVVSGAAGLGLAAIPDLPKQDRKVDFEQHVRFLLTEYTQPSVWQVPTEQPQLATDDPSSSAPSATRSRPQHQSLESRLLIAPGTCAAADTVMTRYMPTGHTSGGPVLQLSADTMRSNVILVCLLLNGVHLFATVLGEDFRQFLLQSLFPVLEKAGSDNLRIRAAAHNCLQTIAVSCNYQSVSELIGSSADYLLNLCTQHLRVLHQHALAARVMRETLNNSDEALLPLLNAFLDEILHVLELTSGSGQDLLLVPVLRSAVCAVWRWTRAQDEEHASAGVSGNTGSTGNSDIFDEPSPVVESSSDRKTAEMDEIRDFFLDYHRQQEEEKRREEEEQAASEDESNVAGTGVPEDDIQPDVPKQLSDSENVGVRVLSYCVHLLPVVDVQSNLIVMETVDQGVRLLQANQEQLLPLVHQLWSPLLHRVRHTHLPIATKAVEIIGVLATVAGDFIRKRVMDDIVPVFVEVLGRPVPAKYTQLHTLLLSVFNSLSILSAKLDLPEKNIVHLSNMCISYLSCKMPFSIQQAAVKLYKQWACSHGDCIWLLLVHLSSCTPHQAVPHASLIPVKVLGHVSVGSGGSSSIVSDVNTNVAEILQCV